MANETIYPYGQGATMPEGYPIANDLDTNSAQKSLSAAMGVELKNRINNAGGDNSSIIKARAAQMANIKWKPLAAMPKNSGSFTANQEYTGLPYSSVKEIDKYIGFDVSIHTFMTAVNNPYSLLYTERTSNGGTSAWGKTYHGVNCGCYMGVVCNVFAQFCSMAPVPFNTGEHAWMAKNKSNFARVNNQTAQGVAVGDIVWSNGHDRCVTDVTRNAAGTVTNVTITESVTDVVKTTAMTAAQFDTYIATNKCIIYRYTGLSPIYIPSPFVAGKGETIGTYTYNDDICTFAGDRASFKVGDTIVINYNLKSVGSWTKMRIYKGEVGSWTQVKEVTLDTSAHVVDLTSDSLTAGNYRAALYNGSTYSADTYFEVVEANVAATASNGITRITFSSANGKPLYYEVCAISGATYAIDGLTDEDRLRGYVDVDLTALNQGQYPSKPFSGTMYVKVHFEGQYGRVANQVTKP